MATKVVILSEHFRVKFMHDQQEDFTMSDEKNYTMNRANAAVLSRDFVLAARLYKSILKKAPDNIEALTQLASCYVRAGTIKSITSLFGNFEKEPNNFSVMNNLGGIIVDLVCT